MADFIIHHNGAYNIFGTIADGPHYVSALTLDQLRELIQHERGEAGLADLPQRLERAHMTGCSGICRSLDDCIAANRWTGDGEGPPGCMPRDEFIRRYLTLESSVGASDVAGASKDQPSFEELQAAHRQWLGRDDLASEAAFQAGATWMRNAVGVNRPAMTAQWPSLDKLELRHPDGVSACDGHTLMKKTPGA